MTKKELSKRYGLFIISLFFAALGVAFTKHGELGVSPISSIPNVINCKFSAISLGTLLIIWNCILIIGQIIILRKDFKLIQLLQIPLSVLFGVFTDIGLKIVSPIPVSNYFLRISMVAVGIIIMGFGISLAVTADAVLNSGEAFVKAISDKWNKNFGRVKIAFDISCVIGAIILSMWFFDFKIVGTREGTIISALITGIFVNFSFKLTNKPVTNLLKKQ